MKYPAASIILTLLLSFIIFILIMFVSGNIYGFILPKVEGAYFQAMEMKAQFNTTLLFSMAFGLIPIAALLLWKIAPIVSFYKRLFSVLVILTCVLLALFTRYKILEYHLVEMAATSANTIENFEYPLKRINFEYYAMGGLCIGCLASYLLFKTKRTELPDIL